MAPKFLRDNGLLAVLSTVAISVVIVRACLQSITIDEAGSYLMFANQSWPAQWFPSSGNHVLNTILMRLITTVVSANELTTRIPAILGAIIYIGSAVYLCLLLTGRKLLQLALFVCLVFNPLILDYLVAARGYSLAVGFLMAALALFAKAVLTGTAATTCRWISILIALSFAANFSFAIAGATILLFLFLWARRLDGAYRAAVACFVPGFLVAFVLAGSVVWTFPKSQLYFGSKSLPEMLAGLRDASFDELNPEVLNPMLHRWVGKLRPFLPYGAALTFLALIVVIEVRRLKTGTHEKDAILTLTRLLIGIGVVTLLLHWIAFRTMHLLLPKDRTGLFFIPLWTLTFGSAMAVFSRSLFTDRTRSAGLVVMAAVSIYFLGCLRLGYFKEWKFDADAKHLYWVVSDLRQRCGITDFVTDWRYEGVLNFYRYAYANNLLPVFKGSTSGELPRGHSAYVIFYPTSLSVIKEEHLNVVYHGGDSDAAVAIRACPSARPESR